jgi:UDP-N-acetylmuramate--alanine ligase
MVAGRDKRLPLVRRAEMLAELMRLQFSVAVGGTHGKTTTTSMVAALLDAGALDPTVVNGGIINAYGTNAKVGEGDWIVVEADESDGSFLKLKSTVAIVTNIDAEHLDHWGDFDAVKKGFQDFIENIPFYGFAAVCTDHPEVQALTSRIENRRLVTYGTNPQAEVRVSNIEMGPEGSKFDILISPLSGDLVLYEGLKMPMAGHHNVLNATAAVAVARELGVDAESIRQGPGHLRRGQAPLHHHGRRQRHPRGRRLRPPPGRDRRRAEGRPRGHGPARSSPWSSRTATPACAT